MRAFDYMFDELGCGPEDVLNVSCRRPGVVPQDGSLMLFI